MKTFKHTLSALLITSSVAMAGGDIAPVEPVVETPQVTEAPAPALNGFYAGLGYSCLQMGLDTPDVDIKAMSGISLTAGYEINPYLAVEGRYTVNVGDINYKTWNIDEDKSWDLSNIGLYLKPKYTYNQFGLYGLLGYGQVTFDNGTSYSEAGLQYGAGVNMMATDNIEVYADYRRLYDDTGFDDYVQNRDVAVNSFTFGANYHF
ncbi:MAG: porin family protein [Sulfurovum sp.]|nr:MAG: porin family protein [Sulfurovum sp.]